MAGLRRMRDRSAGTRRGAAKPELYDAAPTPSISLSASTVNPVYEKRKVLRYSLTGVAPGTLVDWSYTRERLKSYLPGDFYEGWSVTTGRPTRRSRYIVDLPASMTPHIREHALKFARTTREANGRRVYTWATKDLPRIKPEPFAADSNDIFQSVAISAPIEWATIGKWYAGLARDRYAMTPELRQTLDTIVARAKTSDDSLRFLTADGSRYFLDALANGSRRRP